MRTKHYPSALGWLLICLGLAGCGADDGSPTEVTQDRVPPATVNDLVPFAGTSSSVALAFTAPGDDGSSGQATTYDLRYTLFPADPDGWASWAQASGIQAPRTGGEPDSIVVAGLTEDAAYSFRLRTADEAGNWSTISNLVIATADEQLDTTPPAAVVDLDVWASTNHSVTLYWTAPGDDGSYGQAAAYDLRRAAVPITDDNWDDATPVPLPAKAAPQPAGTRETVTVPGLAPSEDYYFAIKVADEIPHWSALSNVRVATTERFRTWYVKADGSGDAATIRTACVDSAVAGDVILVAPGRYTWSNQGDGDSLYGLIFLPRDVTGWELRSEAGPEATIIDAEDQGRVFHLQGITPGSDLNITIDGFTITGGNAMASTLGDSAGGGMVIHLCSPTIRNCIFRDNRALFGGGFAQAGVGAPRIQNCIIEANTALIGGGLGLVNSYERAEIIDCIIRNNRADKLGTNNLASGGGLYARNFAFLLDGCSLYGNLAEDNGAAVYCNETHPSTILSCTIVHNTTGLLGNGGGIRPNSVSQLRVERTIIAFSGAGGGIRTTGFNSLEVACCDIYGNTGGDELPGDVTDDGGNFSQDPLFCGGPGSSAFPLQSTSPCAAGQHPQGAACGLLGAYDVGCAGRGIAWR